MRSSLESLNTLRRLGSAGGFSNDFDVTFEASSGRSNGSLSVSSRYIVVPIAQTSPEQESLLKSSTASGDLKHLVPLALAINVSGLTSFASPTSQILAPKP